MDELEAYAVKTSEATSLKRTRPLLMSLRGYCPPVLRDFLLSFSGSAISFSGIFPKWSDASSKASGYSADSILNQAAAATRKVISGEAKSERDGVTFDKALHPFPLISTFLLAAAENAGELTVLDFGGALGSTFLQCSSFLQPIKRLQWCVVEQRHFVELGRQHFRSDKLDFFESIAEVLIAHRPSVILFSSSLQYLPEPYRILKEAIDTEAKYIVVDRTPFITSDESLISLQTTPRQIVESSYPVWLFSEAEFRGFLCESYAEVASFDAVDGAIGRGRLRATFKGMVFRKIEGGT